jgi:DNA polymerase-1
VASRCGNSVKYIGPRNDAIPNGVVNMPVAVETRMPTSRCRKNVEKLTDRLNAPVQGTGADGLKLALALLWERRSECPGTLPVLVCHDEVVVECDAERVAEAKIWLKGTMIEGMDVVLNGTDKVDVPVEVEARIARR